MKKKIAHAGRRMRYEDPWVVWNAFRAIRIKSIMYRDRDEPDAPEPHPWITVDDIAAQLYGNWSTLNEHQKSMVKLCKLDMVVCFLKTKCWIEEHWEMRDKPKRFTGDWPEREQVYLKEYRARPGTFIGGFENHPTWWRIQAEQQAMSQSWYDFRGRPTTEQLLARVERHRLRA